MPAHSFMIADLMGSLAAVCLFPLFVLAPGYAVAWLVDLFGFRRRTAGFRVAVSIPLSISICPIATYLAGRFASMNAVWVMYACFWAGFLVAVARGFRGARFTLTGKSLGIAGLFACWMAFALFSLVDLQIDDRNYFSIIAFDYSIRVQFIHSIVTTGIPPANPLFTPGHAVPLRYHYFWLLLCALVNRAGGALVSPRQAWIGGAVWCGFGFMALVASYFRLFCYRGPDTFRRRSITAIMLLGVTGLDILPTILLWGLQAAGMHGVLPSMEWWNEQVDGFVYTALWEAHYLSGLIACLMAFLILWEASRQTAAGARVKFTVIGGIALASAGGASVYVSCVFGIFLVIWTAVTIARRWWRETAVLVSAGLIAIALFLPYAAALRGPASGGPPVQFWIRPFYPVESLFRGQGLVRGLTLPLANAMMLPLNYFLELGFFAAAGLVWWKRRQRPLAREDLAIAAMIATSVLICTFVRSTVIGNNDLGWRGFLIAQFGLLLWAVDSLTLPRYRSGFLKALLIVGAAGTLYDVAILRLYPLLADHGAVATLSWMAPDRQFGKRNYAAREAYEWAAAAVPPAAIIQFNPHVDVQDTSAFLYSSRPMLAGADDCDSSFGGDPALCPAVISQLNQIYPRAGGTAAASIDRVCGSLPIDIVVAKDTDPPWADRRSWVWTEKPVFANSYVRMFRCGRAAAP